MDGEYFFRDFKDKFLSNMEQLPIEVLKMIFDHLSVDQLNDCLRVCKKWQFTIDCLMNFDCLVVYQTFLPVAQTHFPSNERVSLRYCIQTDAFIDALTKSFTDELADSASEPNIIYRHFRRLFFYDIFTPLKDDTGDTGDPYNFYYCEPSLRSRSVQQVMKAANCLKQLEELQLVLRWIDADIKASTVTLSLPSLKIFKSTHRFNCKLVLDAPQLNSLSIYNFHSIKILHPETIETFEIQGDYHPYNCFFIDEDDAEDYDSDEKHFFLRLISLTGLKYLLIEDRTGPYIAGKRWRVLNFLRDRLKEIHFFGLANLWRWSFLYSAVKALREQVKPIRVYYHGLEIDCLRDLLESRGEKEADKHLGRHTLTSADQPNFYLANRSSLSKTLPLYRVEYSLIEKLVVDGLDLFDSKRLPKLERVIVNGQVKDELAFGRWLSGLNSLKEIVFRCDLSPQFYWTTLPASCPALQCISLDDRPDLSFLFKLKFIIRIRLNRLGRGVARFLYSNLVYLHCIRIDDQDHLRRHSGLE